MPNTNYEELDIDLEELKQEINGYTLRKTMVMEENYTVKDVLIVGLRTLDREKKWQEKHGSQNQKEKIAKLEKAIKELGGNPEDYFEKQ